MQKDAFKRYSSAESMADDLKRYLDGQPILARPISTVELFVRWCKRKPMQAGLSVATAVLAVLLVASGVIYAANLKRKNDVIEGQNQELDRKNVALAHEKDEVVQRGEALASNFRFLLRNTATDLKFLNLPKQREALMNFIMGDLKRVEGLPGDSAGVDDRARLGVMLNLGEIYHEAAVAPTTDKDKRKEYEDKAGEQFDQAVALSESVAATRPESDLAVGNWALALARRGDYRLKTGKAVDAGVDVDKAFRLRAAIAEDPKSRPGTRDHLLPADRLSSLAESYLQMCNLTGVQTDKAKYAEYLKKVEELNEQALKMVEGDPKTTEEPTGVLAFRRRLGNAYASLGQLATGARRKAFWEKARDLREKVTAAEPDSLPDRAALADIVGRLGNIALFAGDFKTAADLYAQKVAHLSRYVSPVETRRLWGLTYYQVATAQLLAGDKKAAVNTYRKSVAARDELVRDSDRQSDKWGLMVSLARCAEFDRAVDVLKACDQKFPDFHYNAACTYSILAGEVGDGAADDTLPADTLKTRREYLDKAWEHLGRAFAMKSNQLGDVKIDPDLAFLRTRSDYESKLETAMAGK
jgi:tetratricopeptide (TPR) repeat protein